MDQDCCETRQKVRRDCGLAAGANEFPGRALRHGVIERDTQHGVMGFPIANDRAEEFAFFARKSSDPIFSYSCALPRTCAASEREHGAPKSFSRDSSTELGMTRFLDAR